MNKSTPINGCVRGSTLAIAGIVIALLTTAAATWAKGRNPNPGILPPGSVAYGKTYGEWAASWWRWALSIPADKSPFTDQTGQYCAEGQSGPVWFRGGAARDRETTCHLPTGKAIFMPVFNWVFGAGVYDCDPSVPGVPCDVPTLTAAAAGATESATVLEVTIDGVPIQNLRDYRAASPGPFSVTFPDNNVLGLPSGSYYPQVADGYWLMLAPLARGEYTLRIYVEAPSAAIQFTSVTHLVVE